MLFVDLNTFYNPRAGGIRTYHQAKIDWFQRHPEHHYLLVGPSRYGSHEWIAPNVEYLALPGFQATADPNGYRALLDIRPIVKRLQEDPTAILEVGDPWWSAWSFTLLKHLGIIKNPLTFFFHSEPIRTYLEPWSKRGYFRLTRHIAFQILGRLFFKVFRQFDHVLTSSRIMESYLNERRIKRTVYVPFGAPESCFQRFALRSRKPGESLRLLYAGRLESDKDIQLLQATLLQILADEEVEVTVMGRGIHEAFFQEFKHPRYRFLGFVSDRDVVMQEFATHHVLLAPGSWETFGLSVLEAMAFGMPVVGPDVGGTWELLQHLKNPLSFKARDAASFLERVRQLKGLSLEALSQEHHEVALQYGTWHDAMDRQMGFYLERYGSP